MHGNLTARGACRLLLPCSCACPIFPAAAAAACGTLLLAQLQSSNTRLTAEMILLLCSIINYYCLDKNGKKSGTYKYVAVR